MALRQILKRLPASSAAWQEPALWSSGATARVFAAAPLQSEESSLKKTALYDFHVQQGGNVQLLSTIDFVRHSLL